MNHVEATGKTIEDAVRSGLVQLGLTRDEVTVEVLSEPKSGFLGIGSKPAVVRVTAKEEAEHVLQRQQEDVRKAEEAEKQAAGDEKPTAQGACGGAVRPPVQHHRLHLRQL